MPEKHRVLVIGGGSIGERQLRCFQQTGRADVSLCEINPKIREDLTARYQPTRVFEDFEQAISQSDHDDIAVICTPAHLHVPMAIPLVEQGFHVLSEKPLSTSISRVSELQNLVRQQGVCAAVAYVFRAHPVLKAMRDAIQSERFGKPLQLVSVGGQHFPHYRPAYREIYYGDRATGGGAIQDALTHVVNAGQWLLGSMTELTADAGHQRLEGVTVEDTVHVIARHQRVMASYSLNQFQAPNEQQITVACENGTIRFEGHHCRWGWQMEPETDWQYETFPELERDSLFIAQARAFLDYVEGTSPPLCSLEEGFETLRLNLAIIAATENRDWQQLQS